MMDLLKLDDFFEKADSTIKKYADVFAIQKKHFDIQTGNYACITNERTMAIQTNNIFLNLLRSEGYDVLLYANEFTIKIDNKLNKEQYDTLLDEVDKKPKENVWKICSVDGYFMIKDFVTKDSVFHAFLEYKMNNSFVYFDLARDYLKYKVYTYKNEINTAFTYIIFDKKENYPSILNHGRPRYELIGKSISKTSLSKDSKIFIYLGKEKPIDSLDNNKPLEEACEKIENIARIADDLNDAVAIEQNIIADDKKILIQSMKYFNSKIIKSGTLRRYYYFIKAVWDKSNELGVFSNLHNIFNVTENEVTTKLIIDEGAKYKTNLSEVVSAKDKAEAYEKGVRGSINTSLFIVSAIDYFNEHFNIGISKPKYDVIHLRSGKDKIPVDLNDTVVHFKEELRKRWSENQLLENNAKKFSYSLMFYIVNLFPIIYDISDDNRKLEFSDEYKSYRIIENLQEELRKTIKWFGLKKIIQIDVNDVIDSKDDAIGELLKFVSHIIKSY